MAETPLAFEIITFVVLALFFIVDLFVIGRRPHVPSTKECVQHIAFFVVMALIFGGCIWFFAGSKPAIEFYSGWLTEYSLSIDNLFVFVIIMSNFAVPKQIQKYVLSIGITIALIFRGIFILIGAALISRFTWVFFLFGAFLIYTAVKLVLGGDEDEEYHENGIIRNLRKIIKITDDYDGEKLRTTKNGVRYWTPMLIVFLTIGTTDVMFLSVVLGFIGVKLIMEALHGNTLPFINGGEGVHWVPEVPTWLSLAVIVLAIGGASVASVIKMKSMESAEKA